MQICMHTREKHVLAGQNMHVHVYALCAHMSARIFTKLLHIGLYYLLNKIQALVAEKLQNIFDICLILIFLQGVLKKMVQCLFCKYLSNQALDFQMFFFSWQLRSIRKFWIQNHFCAILGEQGINKTK